MIDMLMMLHVLTKNTPKNFFFSSIFFAPTPPIQNSEHTLITTHVRVCECVGGCGYFLPRQQLFSFGQQESRIFSFLRLFTFFPGLRERKSPFLLYGTLLGAILHGPKIPSPSSSFLLPYISEKYANVFPSFFQPFLLLLRLRRDHFPRFRRERERASNKRKEGGVEWRKIFFQKSRVDIKAMLPCMERGRQQRQKRREMGAYKLEAGEPFSEYMQSTLLLLLKVQDYQPTNGGKGVLGRSKSERRRGGGVGSSMGRILEREREQ